MEEKNGKDRRKYRKNKKNLFLAAFAILNQRKQTEPNKTRIFIIKKKPLTESAGGLLKSISACITVKILICFPRCNLFL